MLAEMLALLLGCSVDPAGSDGVYSPPVDTTETTETTDTSADTPSHDSGSDSGSETTSPRANILIVMSDDLGIESSACYEEQLAADRAPQPTIEGLCRSGLTFTSAWSGPLCSPSRAAIMTGRYSWRNEIGDAVGEHFEPLSADEITIPQILETTSTAYIGKWHLANWTKYDHPNLLGWDHFEGMMEGELQDFFSYEEVTNGERSKVSTYATTEVVDDALEWLTKQEDTPWMMWLSFNAPHTPLHVPPSALHSDTTLTGDDIFENPIPYFQAMIEAMDTELGRLLEAVDLDNTIVIYLGDNGTESPMNQRIYPSSRSKGTLYQGGVHIPMIISGPGVASGTVDSIVHVVDLYATIAELSGAALPDVELDSVSLMPYLADPSATPQREIMLTEVFGPRVSASRAGRAARTADYKLIRLFTGVEEFYHLTEDPMEFEDLSNETLSGPALTANQQLSSFLDGIKAAAE